MAHKSEDSQRLKTHTHRVSEITQLRLVEDRPSVVLLSLPCQEAMSMLRVPLWSLGRSPIFAGV